MLRVFTIGHSNHRANFFISLLARHSVDLVVDVRSNPHSRYRHFNRDRLEARLESKGIAYLYLGDRLGGHPKQESLYLDARVIYERIAKFPTFTSGIKRVVEECEQKCVVLMCAEHDHEKCHRHPLLASALQECGVQVIHIQRDGSLQDASEVPYQINLQIPLFEPPGEDRIWLSPKRIPGHGRGQRETSEATRRPNQQSYLDTRTGMATWLQSRLVSGSREIM